jgi:hypothetical protein
MKLCCVLPTDVEEVELGLEAEVEAADIAVGTLSPKHLGAARVVPDR